MVGWSAHAGWETEPVSLQAAATETGGREFRLIVSGTATAAIKMAAAAIESQRTGDRLERIRHQPRWNGVVRTKGASVRSAPIGAEQTLSPSIDRILSSNSAASGLSDRKKSELTDGRAS